MPYYISPPPQGPLTRIVTAIVAAFVLLGAFTIGIAALLIVLGVGLIAGLLIWIRVAWIKRRLRNNGVDLGMKTDAPAESGHIIDAEYTVISDPHEKGE